MLDRGVAGAAFVDLKPCDRPDVDDVSVLGLSQQRQASPRHPHEPEHVGLPHADPLFVDCLGHWIQAERTAGVVDQHVDPAETLCHLANEFANALFLGDIERQSDSLLARHPLEPFHPPRADHDPETMAPKSDRGGGPDAG